MFAPGDLIGPYTVRRRLGAGGMGEVYLAEHRLMGRRAAIKVLLPALSSKPDIVTRFFNEARATAAIRHPGIVNILDCDVQPNGRAYIVMEYLEGESLGASLSRVGSFENDMKMVAATIGQIADALDPLCQRE
jgi:serine/threonine-protein kinase